MANPASVRVVTRYDQIIETVIATIANNSHLFSRSDLDDTHASLSDTENSPDEEEGCLGVSIRGFSVALYRSDLPLCVQPQSPVGLDNGSKRCNFTRQQLIGMLHERLAHLE